MFPLDSVLFKILFSDPARGCFNTLLPAKTERHGSFALKSGRFYCCAGGAAGVATGCFS